jgi:tRNA A-37 threonylcarbamoyl transferase component Bud32
MEAGNKLELALRHFNFDLKVNIKSITNGVNSNVYIIDDNKYVLKFYRSDNNHPNRLERESYALDLFDKYKIDNVPKIIDISKEHNCCLMSYLEGQTVNNFKPEYLSQFAFFYKNILQISNNEMQKYFESIDSCPILNLLLEQINKRITSLEKENNLHLKSILKKLNVFIELLGKNINPIYYNNLKTELSIVDFGINNVIINKNKLFFIDFEFFGLDNPVHLISDTIAHPANNLNLQDQIIFLENLIQCHNNREEIVSAFNGTNILFDIKWCLIMLNPFLGTYSLNINEAERENRKRIQLEKVINKIFLIEQKIKNEYFLH